MSLVTFARMLVVRTFSPPGCGTTAAHNLPVLNVMRAWTDQPSVDSLGHGMHFQACVVLLVLGLTAMVSWVECASNEQIERVHLTTSPLI